MRAVKIAELKNNLSRYLNEVREGRELIVKDRNTPIARIVPLEPADSTEESLASLVADGIARPPQTRAPLPKSFWQQALPEADIDLVALIREDRDGR